MRQLLIAALAITSTGLPGCASMSSMRDTALCNHLNTWAVSVPRGQSRTVRLVRSGIWMVNHEKKCEHLEEDQAGDTLCAWLMENTSTEFMEANINLTISCLQGQQISGYVGNTGIESWSGKASFYSPHLSAENVRVDLVYSLDNSLESREDFLQITVRAR